MNNCVLCGLWSTMPYQKRYSTPTNAQQTEAAMVAGYWLAIQKRSPTLQPICERHANVLQALDEQELQREVVRKAAEAKVQAETEAKARLEPNEFYRQQIAELQQRKKEVLEAVNSPPSSSESEFQIGPGPLVNHSQVTPQPALPSEPDLVAAYRAPILPEAIEPAVETILESSTQNVRYICPLCGKGVANGQVHAC